jgi:hypothetical protein
LIYVKRNPALIPEKILKVAERAQQELEKLPEAERKGFIEKKAPIWRSFSRHLAKMSYGKCWYSESNDPQSFFDVDHFRPKKEAKRTEGVADDGYPWLAFNWGNFRYSAGRSNRLSKDEVSDETRGKGSWFPVMTGSAIASWGNRCEQLEKPVLLDPTVRADVALIDINPDDGRVVASRTCIGPDKQLRASKSIELYGLNLPRLLDARKIVLRDVQALYENLMDIVVAANDMPAIERLQLQMIDATHPRGVYSRAARAKLHSLGAAMFCAQPEDLI